MTEAADIVTDRHGRTYVFTLEINTEDTLPDRSHLPPKWKEGMKEEFDKLLGMCIIDLSDIRWFSPITAVGKMQWWSYAD